MEPGEDEIDQIEVRMAQLFALVSEALAGATEALLSNDVADGLTVVEGDQAIDDLTAEVELLVWERLGNEPLPAADPCATWSGSCSSSPSWSAAAIWPSTSPSAPPAISAPT